MNRDLLTLILLLSVFSASAQEMIPIESGTIIVEDKFIRLNTCIFKSFPLTMTKQYYEQHQDIQVIAAISNLKMNNKLAFQFKYNINCQQKPCILDLTVQRFTQQVNPFYGYQLDIDFLIAHGIKAIDFNMTYFRQTVYTQLDTPFERAILIPQGFDDVSLTGNVALSYMPKQSANFILEYTDPSGKESRQTSMGWTTNKHFIKYKVVFLFHSYKVLNNAQGLFSGFESTRNQEIHSQLTVNPQNMEISSTDYQGISSYFYLPIGGDGQFKDQRNCVLQRNQPKTVTAKVSSFLTRVALGLFVIFSLEIGFIIYRKKVNRMRTQTGVKQPIQVPELLISYNESFNERRETTQKQSQQMTNPCQSAGQMAHRSDAIVA